MNRVAIYDKVKRIVPSDLRTKIRGNMPLGMDYRWMQQMSRKDENQHPEKREYRKKRFTEAVQKGLDKIPVFLISYNRLSYLETTIRWLEDRNIRNIKIIDNGSTYPPLLNYYEQTEYEVIRLGYNGGHMVFWKDPKFDAYRKDFYIVSDPDLEAVSECPTDIIEKLFGLLWKYPFVNKTGLSLKIDDLPENGIFGKQVTQWEKRFNKIEVENSVYYAPIDTTFALYLPDDLFDPRKQAASLRVGYPYQLRHLPWYKTKEDITEEDEFYAKLQTNGWWNTSREKVTKDRY